MNISQVNRLMMYEAVHTVMAENRPKWESIPGFAAAFKALHDSIAGIMEAGALQQQTVAAASAAKLQLRGQMTDHAVKMTGALSSYALDTGIDELRETMRFTRSDFLYGAASTSIENAQLVLNHAKTFLKELRDYGITPADVNALAGAIDSFHKRATAPRVAIGMRAAMTQKLLKLFGSMDTLLREKIDGLMERFAGTDFYNTYTTVREVVDIGHRSKLITFTVQPGDTITVHRVVNNSVLTNTGAVAIIVTGDLPENEDGVEVAPGDNMAVHITNPVLLVRNMHSTLAATFTARVSSTVPVADPQRKASFITVKVGPGEHKRIDNIVRGSEISNLGPAVITVCDCAEPDCGITDDDQPCGYEQTIDVAGTGTLDTEQDFVNISNADKVKSAKVKIKVR
jgi:hypothetical protein